MHLSDAAIAFPVENTIDTRAIARGRIPRTRRATDWSEVPRWTTCNYAFQVTSRRLQIQKTLL